ncbi:IS1096 element passenger TnpR family protein [Emticicia agri]|uniref:Plasmid pRiA4b Orf3-like domain-containing protein n=1 Tax=Emticicia agri TaxID=2492393 RepID=A0A4Q5M309_9BACT|nr:hypothetical protein [Emticicia agri]RYU96746.1 hypothetical protein EWM59_04215 [Emticicia agri]
MPQIYQLKITLFEKHIQPPIWRTITINSEQTLFDLHYVIQGAMGWECAHLYAYYHVNSSKKPDRKRAGYADLALVGDESDFEDGSSYKIRDIFQTIGDSMLYEYDFGDSWIHTVCLEEISYTLHKVSPFCIDGQRNCPPEDCGSLPGYLELVEALKKPNSKQAKEFKEWLGETYNPEEFSIQQANYRIQLYINSSETNMFDKTVFDVDDNLNINVADFLNLLLHGDEIFNEPINYSSVSGKVLVLKITVQGVKPEISRTIEVASSLKFRDLMKLIRASFGWIDANTDMGYYFIIGGQKIGKTSLFNGWYMPTLQKKIPSQLFDDSTIKLNQVFTEKGVAINSKMPLHAWKFRIKCESIKKKDKNANYPVCVAAKGNLTSKPSTFEEIGDYIDFINKPNDIPSDADLESINRLLTGFRKK